MEDLPKVTTRQVLNTLVNRSIPRPFDLPNKLGATRYWMAPFSVVYLELISEAEAVDTFDAKAKLAEGPEAATNLQA